MRPNGRDRSPKDMVSQRPSTSGAVKVGEAAREADRLDREHGDGSGGGGPAVALARPKNARAFYFTETFSGHSGSPAASLASGRSRTVEAQRLWRWRPSHSDLSDDKRRGGRTIRAKALIMLGSETPPTRCRQGFHETFLANPNVFLGK